MAEPYGEKWKKVKIWPPLQTNKGFSVNQIKINTRTLGAVGPMGPPGEKGDQGFQGALGFQGFQGFQGVQGSSNEFNSQSPLQVTSPNGTVYEIIVDDSGNLSTRLLSGSGEEIITIPENPGSGSEEISQPDLGGFD